MASHEGIDAGRDIDWGRTSRDYARHRPGPPGSFYRRLEALGIGTKGQRILDLGTGTGHLARSFASRGCRCAGVDVAEEQIEAAKALAREQGLEIDFRVAPAENTTHADAAFDVITANQCLLYFDLPRAIEEMRRVLVPGGHVVVSHFTPMPREDAIVRASEELVLEFNPDWSGADWHGRIPARPGWSREVFEMPAMFYYDEPIPFTRESWRGRMRTLRGIGASLPSDEVARFDEEHAALLEGIAPPAFEVLHRIDAHVFRFLE